MKLFLGYILAFLAMCSIVTAGCFAIFLVTLGAIIFVSWSLPPASIAWLVVIRICITIGSFIGIWFICDNAGKDMAKSIANDI